MDNIERYQNKQFMIISDSTHVDYDVDDVVHDDDDDDGNDDGDDDVDN